jgi:hypothetical protein
MDEVEFRGCLKSIKNISTSFCLASDWKSGLTLRSPFKTDWNLDWGWLLVPLVDLFR